MTTTRSCTSTCVAARPMPSASYMVSSMSATSGVMRRVHRRHGLGDRVQRGSGKQRMGSRAMGRCGGVVAIFATFAGAEHGHKTNKRCPIKGLSAESCVICQDFQDCRDGQRDGSIQGSYYGQPHLGALAGFCRWLRWPCGGWLAAPAAAQNLPDHARPSGPPRSRWPRPACRCRELSPNAPDTYTVKRGDTLWAISGMFLNSPWRWPELWGMNMQEVRNPHRIYPGQQLVLEKIDGLRAPAHAAGGRAGHADRHHARFAAHPLSSRSPTARCRRCRRT